MLTDLDFQLINALQIDPRAPWTTLAPILNVAPSTLSRRWKELQESGLAWTSVLVGELEPGVGPATAVAFVEVACASGTREAIADVLVAIPWIASIDYTSGGRELFLTVMMESIMALDKAVAREVVPVAGVTATRTHFVRTLFQEGSSSHLSVLPPMKADAIRAERDSVQGPLVLRPDDELVALVCELQADVRRPGVELAATLRFSVAKVRRLLNVLERAPWCLMRTDFANPYLDFSAYIYLWFTVAHDQLSSIVAGLRLLPQVRLIATVVGPSNLLISVWLPRLHELDSLELRLVRAFPGLKVDDRWLVSLSRKRIGHMLDQDGLHLGCVPTPVLGGAVPRSSPVQSRSGYVEARTGAGQRHSL